MTQATPDGGRDRDPSNLAPQQAVERYLRRRQSDATDASVKTWRYRLKLFVEWCQSIGLQRVGDLQGYDLDEYYEYRAADIEPATLQGEMWTLRKFIEYLEQLDAVEDGLEESVRIPDIDDEDRADETLLDEAAAIPLLQAMRDDPEWFGTREHAILELAWYTGARIGGLRALDLSDVDLDDAYVVFRHRPDTGTPLKNKYDGERAVALRETNVTTLRRYIEHHRDEVHDDHGRQPLLTSQLGRPIKNTLRGWMYLATQPCIHTDCPHGKERTTCEWTEFGYGSKCPSSRSPHQVRTGSITWQLNKGVPPEIVSERVNAGLEVIERHYDQEGPIERMERRRRHYIDALDLENNNDNEQ